MKILKAFFKEPRQTGAVASSSRFLVKKMVQPVNFESAKHIVELGPGTGVITRALMQRMGKNTQLTLIEANEDFAQPLLTVNDSRLRVFNADAQELSRFVDAADTVISSIPLVAANDDVAENILQSISKTPGLQTYIQFAYSRKREDLLKKYFDISRSRVLLNIPPAHVYVCIPKKS